MSPQMTSSHCPLRLQPLSKIHGNGSSLPIRNPRRPVNRPSPYVQQLLAHLVLRKAQAANQVSSQAAVAQAVRSLRSGFVEKVQLPWKVGKYLLEEPCKNDADWYQGHDTASGERIRCKVTKTGSPQNFDTLLAHNRLRDIRSISPLLDIVRTKVVSSAASSHTGVSAAVTLDCFFYRRLNQPCLDEYIRSRVCLPEDEARCIFRDLVELVGECHNRSIALTALKLRKIHLDPIAKRGKITLNLDNSTVLSSGESSYLEAASGAYEQNRDRLKSDVWCLGIILFALIMGRYPFFDMDVPRLIQNVNTANFGTLPRNLSAELGNLIPLLLEVDAKKRPSCIDILNHPWLADARESVATPRDRQLREDSNRSAPRL